MQQNTIYLDKNVDNICIYSLLLCNGSNTKDIPKTMTGDINQIN